jgi:hypothetical protein
MPMNGLTCLGGMLLVALVTIMIICEGPASR